MALTVCSGLISETDSKSFKQITDNLLNRQLRQREAVARLGKGIPAIREHQAEGDCLFQH